ncbi:MAG TPA: hypothetical protein ENK28_11795 [Aliiroseovarius sp.]|nr:hypothetical protein [Aliiroseovarius sp.]
MASQSVSDEVYDDIYADADAPDLAGSVRKTAAPSKAVRLFSTGFMAFIKGAIGSAFLVAPFFGPWAALGTTLAFTAFCLGLAVRKLPQDAGEQNIQIQQADTCYPKVRR